MLYILVLLLSTYSLSGYYLPSMNLGTTNFLDGGQPTPGFYWVQFYGYTYTPAYMTEHGHRYPGEKSQQFNNLTAVLLGVVDTTLEVFKANWGFDVSLPITLFNHTNRDDRNRKSTSWGQGDLAIGSYLQWKPIMKDGRKIFENRLELITGFPTGKNKKPDVDPGRDCYIINPYWAATYYFLPHWGLSWRVNYAWFSKNKKTQIKPGTALFINFDLECETFKDAWIGMNAYYLQQLTDTVSHNKKMHHTKEQAVAVGPGGIVFFPKGFTMIVNLYFEVQARNRAESIRFIWRLVKLF